MIRRLVGTGATAPADKRRGALSLAALAFSGAAQAITLGDAQVRSALGAALEARIPVSAAPGENLRGACFSLAPRDGTGAPALTEAELALRRSAHGTYLEVRSRKPIAEPDVRVSIAVACPGTAAPVARDFALLLEPAVRTAPPQVAGSMALRARDGDTLKSIARALVPNGAARADYLGALREANPALAQRGDDASIAPGETIALPDLRTYARASHRAVARAPAPPREVASATPPFVADAPIAVPQPAARRKSRASAAAPVAANAPTRANPFQLKLSAPEIDLSASRNIGERERAQLRERLAMLDADDQVAAMLSLRHSLKQLEARVAELQLKLATVSPTLEARAAKAPAEASSASPAPRAAAPAAATTQPSVPATPPAQASTTAPSTPAATSGPSAPPATTPQPTTTAQPKAAVPPATAVQPTTAAKPAIPAPPSPAPQPSPSTPAPSTAAAGGASSTVPPATPSAAKAAPSESTAAAATPAAAPAKVPTETASTTAAPGESPPPAQIDVTRLRKPHVAVASGEASRSSFWLWIAGGAVALLLLVALFLRARRGADEAWLDEPEVLPPADDEIAPATAGEIAAEPMPRVLDSDAELPTRLPTADAEELRRRYMRERFPELATGMVNLDDAASVVKGARLLYEDGAAPRAVELLQFAIETHPEELRQWLALFEIYRLERLTGEFGALAQRFHERFGESEHWHKVRYFGREIDPSNALYQDVVDTLQTIGPRESRRLAAGASFDPLAENWLNAPMDFENEVLANELRNALMQKAAVTDQDLQPNPMPALRHVEMFTVA